ncbi:MAG: ABC transporter permease [Chromatiaceae bacterium]|nr:ABC transporter permease [Gammaproteobacteria bacterium]MCP5318739.1 ABC transporter permease [Chromatiaceae bacterium]MCP5429816.1 ABC transporter permease [Chromatiaceae bacterium]MCP5435572.1 ABC transporter permease [Chromatiaceae bacterium]HOP15808.1 ABC transporter permease [Gammaproteobacteria bacterium]
MRTPDLISFALRSLSGARTRTLLMLLAMSIGVASVVLLTALGEGARRYVVGEFAQLGTHLLIMLPGRSETTGGAPPLLGATPRDLTLDDAMALLRERSILRVAPLTVGNAPVSHGSREREVTVIGATADFFPIRHLTIGSGKGLPALDPGRGANVVVIGSGLRRELFGGQRALGQWVRIDDRRFRVIGILGEGGESLGQNLDDMAVIPVASAQVVFDTPSLFRVLIQARGEDDIERAKKAAREIIRERHDGEDDVTIISQDALLSTFDKILGALTYTVGGIAAISLVVAGILIMNVMLVAVSQRVAEIGLLKALGAPERQVLRLFLVESVMLAAAGAALGVLIAAAGILALREVFPTFPIAAPLWATPAAVGVAIVTGLVFGVLPARRAARLDPVRALSGR